MRLDNVKIPDRKKTINVSQLLGRTKANEDTSVIVTPDCELWLGHRVRMMAGVEALALQGVHYGDAQSKPGHYADHLLKDLGGTATMSLCCGVRVLINDIFVARCNARAMSATQVANSTPPTVSGVAQPMASTLDDVLEFYGAPVHCRQE